jgi:hypothetical protein
MYTTAGAVDRVAVIERREYVGLAVVSGEQALRGVVLRAVHVEGRRIGLLVVSAGVGVDGQLKIQEGLHG